jgi:hypothetical protein
VIERLIENWLDNVNERGYELAFCQALTAEGHTILRRPAHGSTEHGKDIVSRDKFGKYHAYQLKTGNLNKTEWRSIRDEITELVEVGIQEPNVPNGVSFIPHLVTNGKISDPVKLEINARNQTWKKRRYNPLQLILKDKLFRIFVDLQGKFLPTNPEDFENYLRLYLTDKKGFIDKAAFSSFLNSFLPLKRRIRRPEAPRVCAATAILANYILSGYQKVDNHLAVAEGWMLVIVYLLRLLEDSPSCSEKDWFPSLNLCVESWQIAVSSLVNETLASQNWIEGNYAVDHFVFHHRRVVLMGYLAAYALYRREIGDSIQEEDQILMAISKNLDPLYFWGESAAPFIFAAVLFLWFKGQERRAISKAIEIIQFITIHNRNKKQLGIPDPYYDGVSLLQEWHMGKQVIGDRQSFVGRSFSLRVFVEFVARRNWKRSLKTLWYEITEIDYCEFKPDTPKDTYFWRVEKGTLIIRRWARPEHWQKLLEMAELPIDPCNLLMKKFPQLVLPFLLVYPHRLTPDLARFSEKHLLETR